MKLIFKFLAVVMILQAGSSCMIPSSKERYLANFERFVNNVEKESPGFKPRDWRYAEKRYQKYSVEWYQNFREDFTPQEQIKVAGLKLRYQAVREGAGLRRLLDEQVVKDLEKMGEDVGKYLDENLDRDLERISKGAREIGDSARKVVDDLVKELRKKK